MRWYSMRSKSVCMRDVNALVPNNFTFFVYPSLLSISPFAMWRYRNRFVRHICASTHNRRRTFYSTRTQHTHVRRPTVYNFVQFITIIINIIIACTLFFVDFVVKYFVRCCCCCRRCCSHIFVNCGEQNECVYQWNRIAHCNRLIHSRNVSEKREKWNELRRRVRLIVCVCMRSCGSQWSIWKTAAANKRFLSFWQSAQGANNQQPAVRCDCVCSVLCTNLCMTDSSVFQLTTIEVKTDEARKEKVCYAMHISTYRTRWSVTKRQYSIEEHQRLLAKRIISWNRFNFSFGFRGKSTYSVICLHCNVKQSENWLGERPILIGKSIALVRTYPEFTWILCWRKFNKAKKYLSRVRTAVVVALTYTHTQTSRPTRNSFRCVCVKRKYIRTCYNNMQRKTC